MSGIEPSRANLALRSLCDDFIYGSHIPALIDVLSVTDGPVVEIGTGFYSTPFLHWWCWAKKRSLVSYEQYEDFYQWAKQFECDYHRVLLVPDCDKMDLTPRWSVALVDHDVGRRMAEMDRLRHAEYVVLHDTQQRRLRRGRLVHGYRYRKTYRHFRADTMVFSNFHALEKT